MPKLRLTTPAVERLRPPPTGQVEYYDTALPAFGLRISYFGSRAWFVMGRVDGKLTRFTLGRYPDLSLADARAAARVTLQHARAGRDPRLIQAEERRQRERERRATFEATTTLFLKRYVAPRLRPNTAREYRRVLQGNDTKEWRDRPMVSFSRDDVAGLVSRIEDRGSPAAADRALAYLSKYFSWCEEEGILEANPAVRVRSSSPIRSRDRVLSIAELQCICDALRVFPGVFGPLFKILMLTGQRRGEVAGMTWEELKNLEGDNPIWELAGQRTKNHQAHLVPLAPKVAQILRNLPRTSSLVFSTTSRSPISGFSKAKRLLDETAEHQRERMGLPALLPWTLHDFRRTTVTVMNERLGIAPHVVEAVVNHISGPAKRGVAGVYNRALYLNERRDALCRWASYLDGLAP